MKIVRTNFEGLFIIKQNINIDKRGFLRETHNERIIKKKFNFEYFTFSKKNILRGFHFQTKYTQSKYVNVIKGKILDCVVDLRKNSKTYCKSFKIILSDKNSLGLFSPKGFAHAYYSYEKENLIYYKLDNYYKPNFEKGIIWNDKGLNIKWPSMKPIVSNKDKKLPSLEQCLKKINF